MTSVVGLTDISDEYLSITIGSKNTWDDWHLVPSSRLYVAPPEVKTEYIDIPGADGSLDFTGALNGLRYGNRTGSWDFIVASGYGSPQAKYSEILNYLHGKKMTIILPDDPLYYYIGRLTVSDFKSNKDNASITINYTIDPFKMLIEDPTVKLL